MNKQDRKNEINFVVDLVQKLCEESKIALMAKTVKGIQMVVVVDATDGQEYYIGRNK